MNDGCPPADDEEARLAALAWYDVVGSVPEVVFDDLVRLAALACDTPTAILSLIDRDRQWFKARVGLNAPWTERSVAICAHGIVTPGILLEVPDTLDDPRFRDMPLVQGDPHIRYYLGAPLVTPEGHALGMLGVIDYRPRPVTDREREVVRILARQAIVHLEMRKVAADLAAPVPREEDRLEGRVARVLDRLTALRASLAEREE